MNWNPKKVFVFVSAETGTTMGLVTDTYHEKVEEEYKTEDLERYKTRLSERMYRTDCPIQCMILPMKVKQNHWGIMVADKMEIGAWELYWGDSLATDCASHRKRIVAAAVNATLEKKVTWMYKTGNYMLDTLKYAKQRDSFSCGAYCLALLLHYSQTRGYMPSLTYVGTFNSGITEKYLCTCAQKPVDVITQSAALNPAISI
ncbi:hypothetical protein BWQ96_07741 [Gracilariopsis chorda]|uniref:Ubiquitin-like protease family profile domain-containing protein n=1 Tax=Gracilariopsis chorda TaxID=448386 RepID=A0A2V3IK98_9FLOR|nr:hypothetical protein BWQ96_07741 [Gracilariopsis chorda]|eukprot:PXF42524.1 hypothetical protein BWQ96_07741 [Gracilariopsis chorda]